MEKSIFYFEDEPEPMKDYIEVLRKKYQVTIGASEELIKQRRSHPVDLVIVDLMIREFSFDDEGNKILNIYYPDQRGDWKRIGVKFLKGLQAGEYEDFGFAATVPVIVATARVDNSIRKEVMGMENISAYLEKPFTVDAFEEAVDTVLGDQEGEGET